MRRPNLAALRTELARPDLPADRRAAIEGFLRDWAELVAQNPLQDFWPHSPPQKRFLEATTPIQAAFAGNRFGKTTALVVKCLLQHCPDEWLPEHLKRCKVATGDPVMGRMLIPSERAFLEYTKPAIQKWCPKALFHGGSWEKAYSKQHNFLTFADGGTLSFYTYMAEPTTMVGAALDYVAYDEPPPEPHRNECLARLIDRKGFEVFALTPVNMKGGGIGWLYRKIWKRREAPHVTVVKASMRDNPLLDEATMDRVLAEYPEEERQAREHGDFLHFGGMVYVAGFENSLVDAPSPERVKDWDVVVGIDPGLRNAAFVWVGFDNDNRAVAFDEVLLQERTPADYARAIRLTNATWGLTNPLYVIDPSARNRSLTNAESVEAVLQNEGIFTMHAQNDVQAGVQQIRGRLAAKALFVSRECRGLRAEADEYRMQDRPDGEFAVVKESDHRLDALRYSVTTRLWHPSLQEKAREALGFVFDGSTAPTAEQMNALYQPPVPPMGAMS